MPTFASGRSSTPWAGWPVKFWTDFLTGRLQLLTHWEFLWDEIYTCFSRRRNVNYFSQGHAICPYFEPQSKKPLTCFHTIFPRSFWVFYFHLQLRVPSSQFLQFSIAGMYMNFLLPNVCYNFVHVLLILWSSQKKGVKLKEIVIMRSSQSSCYFLLLWSKHSPEYLQYRRTYVFFLNF